MTVGRVEAEEYPLLGDIRVALVVAFEKGIDGVVDVVDQPGIPNGIFLAFDDLEQRFPLFGLGGLGFLFIFVQKSIEGAEYVVAQDVGTLFVALIIVPTFRKCTFSQLFDCSVDAVARFEVAWFGEIGEFQ